MLTDARGLEVGTDSAAAVAAIDRFTVDFLAARCRSRSIGWRDCGRRPECGASAPLSSTRRVSAGRAIDPSTPR